jgi:hypothetical protein
MLTLCKCVKHCIDIEQNYAFYCMEFSDHLMDERAREIFVPPSLRVYYSEMIIYNLFRVTQAIALAICEPNHTISQYSLYAHIQRRSLMGYGEDTFYNTLTLL